MKRTSYVTLTLAVLTIGLLAAQAEAAGCPFEDASCQEYCNTQGCNLGYCGHFAWIQCICRKCGDEWSWYDKVRYNPDKTVNQTELDSLKLNGSAPLILTNSSEKGRAAPTPINMVESAKTAGKPAGEPKPATLTTLLIPDLSAAGGRLDLNDIPDENSEKFLDYLAKNHERLAQATSLSGQPDAGDQQDEQDEQDSSSESPSTGAPSTSSSADDDTIELQISTKNNNKTGSEQQPQASSPVTRLLRLVAASDDSLLSSETTANHRASRL